MNFVKSNAGVHMAIYSQGSSNGLSIELGYSFSILWIVLLQERYFFFYNKLFFYLYDIVYSSIQEFGMAPFRRCNHMGN
jgi:hypothetical protein